VDSRVFEVISGCKQLRRQFTNRGHDRSML
jgi:hypothetical protein